MLNELADLVKNIPGNEVPIINEPSREGDIKISLADISLAQEMLGYAPEYTVREGRERIIGRSS